MGKISEFIQSCFDDYRNSKITLKELVEKLCSFSDYNIHSQKNMNMFLADLREQFNEEGDVRI